MVHFEELVETLTKPLSCKSREWNRKVCIASATWCKASSDVPERRPQILWQSSYKCVLYLGFPFFPMPPILLFLKCMKLLPAPSEMKKCFLTFWRILFKFTPDIGPVDLLTVSTDYIQHPFVHLIWFFTKTWSEVAFMCITLVWETYSILFHSSLNSFWLQRNSL